jgi:hypothetical protein
MSLEFWEVPHFFFAIPALQRFFDQRLVRCWIYLGHLKADQWKGFRSIRRAAAYFREIGWLSVKPWKNLIYVKKETELGMEGVIVFAVLHLLGMQVRG